MGAFPAVTIKRSFLDPIILSTLPHGLAILVPVGIGYSLLVALSTTLSVLWHRYGEPKSILFWLDYLVAFVWTVVDIALALPTPVLLPVILLNGLCLVTNQLADALARQGLVSYETGHTAWHLLSCVKAITVAALLHAGLST